MRQMIEASVLREKLTTRGGGIEISLDPFGFDGHKMAVYQNYLGGGMLGRVMVNNTYTLVHKTMPEEEALELERIGNELKLYYIHRQHYYFTGDELSDEEAKARLSSTDRMPAAAY